MSNIRVGGRVHEAAVGVFVVIGVAALAVMIFAVGTYHPFERGYVVSIGFRDVAGLSEKSTVQISGAPFGRVVSIDLHPPREVPAGAPGASAGPYTVTVEVFLASEVVLHEDVKAEITSIGFAGEKAISIDPGLAGDRLGAGAFIRGVDPVSIPEMLLRAKGAIEEAEGVLRDVRPFTRFLGDTDLHGEVRGVVSTARAATEEFRELGREARASLAASVARFDATVERVGARAEAAVADIRLFASDLREVAREARGRLHTAADALEWEIHRVGDSAVATIDEARPILAEARAATAEARAASEILRAGIETAVADVTDASGDVRRFVAENRSDLEAAIRTFRVAGEEMRLATASIRRMTEAVERGEGTMGAILRDEELAANLRRTAENLAAATEKIDKLVEEIRASPRRFIRLF